MFIPDLRGPEAVSQNILSSGGSAEQDVGLGRVSQESSGQDASTPPGRGQLLGALP